MKIILEIDLPGDMTSDFEIGDMLETIRHSVELGGNTSGHIERYEAKWNLELEADDE